MEQLIIYVQPPLPPPPMQLWLRGRASIVLLEGNWFSSLGLHLKVSLGKILNPTLLLMCWSAPYMTATIISVWTYVWITVSRFGQKRLPQMKN